MKTKQVLLIVLLFFAVIGVKAQDNEEKSYLPFAEVEIGDIEEALRLIGINIYKHDIGIIGKNPEIKIIVEEWEDFKLVNSWTGLTMPLESTFMPGSSNDIQKNNIIRTTSIAKNDSLLIVEIAVNDMLRQFHLKQKKLDTENRHLPYFPVPYKYKQVQQDKNIPLVLYGTMWYDENFNVYRFCGRNYLTDEADDEATEELMLSSPHYYIISYWIENSKE